MAGRDDRIRREAVDLGLVEEEEESAEASHAVTRVLAVEAGSVPPPVLELRQALLRSRTELVERAELDRIGRARPRAGGARAVPHGGGGERGPSPPPPPPPFQPGGAPPV